MAKEKSVPVATIKSMADEIPTFPLPLKIKRLNGTETEVEVTAKAMRKSEWAALRDAHMTVEKVEQEEGEAPRFSFVKAVGDDMRKGAELIAKCGTGWDLADPFTADSLADMEDTFGGTLARFLSDYDAAIFHGRVGNS
ncbi:phage tail assembly chaperone [Acidovorax radicis]|uniref:phage tail assembly chaperone n=1 Tax=Acidovorax radicis TaxID=758826 RepID=UPI001CFA3342|nr:phage tail assembly chaperone [Acidovorax radicis]UCV00298.1 hypothetical protein KI609_05800 [Acidovorax radicis]